MNRKKINNLAIVFCLLLICFAGCKTKQKLTPETPTELTDKKEETNVVNTPTTIPLDYQWISYRIGLSYKDYRSGAEKISASAFFVNKKDSIMYLTINKLGIEGMRIVITPDSVKFLNHLNSTFYLGDYSFLEKMLGFKVNFYLLQAVFLGENVSGFDADYTYSFENDTHTYASSYGENKALNLNMSQVLKINADFKIIENHITEFFSQASIRMRYGSFAPLENQSFFQQAEIIVPDENILLEFQLRNIKINVPGPTSIQIPKKYTPIKN